MIITNNEINKFQLSFTNIPIIQIITPNKIYDEPKTIAKIIVNHPNKNSEKYFIGIEYRGGTSQLYSKKSFGFSIKGSINLDDDISVSLFDMKNNNDWILDAMWIDNARLRNKTSFELWKKIGNNLNHGISSVFVELYINNEHQGLYCLNENINSEFLNINNSNAVVYKATAWENGATRFEKYTNSPPVNYYWDGWEQKYPDPKIEINWQPLNELRMLVVNEDDNVFKSRITSLIELNNFIDYFIFLNLISAMDNTGKNTFLVKENTNEKFNIIPWDLDGSWGIFWDGTNAGHSSILTNKLFDRLIFTNIDNFTGKLKKRWTSLRVSTLSDDEIEKVFAENFAFINQSDIINIENETWKSNIDSYHEQEYLMNWMENRVNFLDNYFDKL